MSSLDLHWKLGDRWRTSSVLESLAGVAMDLADPERAVKLFAAADAIRERIGTPLAPAEEPDYHRDISRVREALGPEQAAVLWDASSAIPPTRLVEYALS